MTTLDDKLMGEKTQNYCSSSSEDDEEPSSSASSPLQSKLSCSKIDINSTSRWEGYSQNTGPKGVIRDWQLYKEHQAAMRDQEQRKLVEDIKKTQISCKSYGDQLELQKQATGNDDLHELLDDDLLQQFVKKRMENLNQLSRFKAKHPGVLVELRNGDEFLKIIENSDARVPVVIHIYEESSKDCKRMNECLSTLAGSYDWVQFCNATTGAVGVSRLFRSKGVPALLVYKGGELVGNFVQLGEELSGEVFPGDVENFLIENGVISEGGGN